MVRKAITPIEIEKMGSDFAGACHHHVQGYSVLNAVNMGKKQLTQDDVIQSIKCEFRKNNMKVQFN